MTSTLTLSDIVRRFTEELRELYSDNEIRNISWFITEHLLNYSKIDFHLKDEVPISAETREKFLSALVRLKNGEPVQYITGSTEFYGLPFTVGPAVLIPRPETEELVDWIIRENKVIHGNFLDIGTGSGCIAVALSVNLPGTTISACDVSEQALQIAALNAEKNKARVAFFRLDVLECGISLPGKYDLIVSNPPYVRNSEKVSMRKNVLDYEPELALFVPVDDPLLYYRNIALLARKYLRDGGKLYFEINENFPAEIVRLLKNSGFYGVDVRKDINGKARMVRACK